MEIFVLAQTFTTNQLEKTTKHNGENENLYISPMGVSLCQGMSTQASVERFSVVPGVMMSEWYTGTNQKSKSVTTQSVCDRVPSP